MKKIFSIFIMVFVAIFTLSTCNGANNDNLLKSLQINQEGLSPNFTPEQLNYSLFVKDSIDNININAIANDDKNEVEIAGNEDLKTGDNEVTSTVGTKTGKKTVYKILVTKTSNIEASDSYLQNLILENITLQPEFKPEIFEYDGGSVPNKVNSILTFASARQDGAKVEITGNENLKEGENIITIKVTSQDGLTNKNYKIKINKEKTENAISNVVEQTTNTNMPNSITDKVDYKMLIIVIVVLIFIIIILLIRNVKLKNSK